MSENEDPAQATGRPVRKGGRPSLEAAGRIEARIVAMAREQFFAHGYGATSIETIARKAHISKRTFYARFQNKAAIFSAVVNELIGKVVPGNIDGLFEGASCETILQGLARAILAASLAPDTLALQRVIIAEATRFPELALVMNEQGARQDAISRIATLLARETRSGRLAVENPAIAAEMFLQLVIGVPQRRAMGLGTPMTQSELDDWAMRAVQLFLNGAAS